MRFKFFIFFLLFSINSKILFYANADLGFSFINYDNFKLGVSLGGKTFDEKFGITKRLFSIGAFFDVLDCFYINSFYVASNILFEYYSLQKIKYIGINCSCSFRTWDFPINVGVVCTYSKFRPNLSFGVIVSFNYHIQKINLNLGCALLYTKTKNFRESFINPIPEYSILNQLSPDLLDVIIKNQNRLEDNDQYFKKNNEILKLEKDLGEIIKKIKNISDLKENVDKKSFEMYPKLMKEFKEKFNILQVSLKQLFKISINTNLELSFFSTKQFDNLGRLVKDIGREVEEVKEDFKEFIENIESLNEHEDEEYEKYQPAFDIEKYLKNLILQIFINFSYFIEIKSTFLNDEDQDSREEILSS